MNNEWQEIVASALVGVERRKERHADSAKPHPEPAEHESEHQLLVAAGTLNLRRKAVAAPRQKPIVPTRTAPPETMPSCGNEAARILRYLLLAERYEIPKIIPEFLRLLASARLRLPEDLLPSLLDYAGNYPSWEFPDLKELVTSVIGKRGLWLAAQNPKWRYALALSDDEEFREEINELWKSKDIDLRLMHLEAVRKRDPAHGLAMVREAWETEQEFRRNRLIDKLRINVRMADEPFLEEALNSPNERIREEAAAVLTRLPDSRFVERMKERGRAMLCWRTPEERIEVIIPTLDEGMVRDCVNSTPWNASDKERPNAHYVTNIIAAIPPDFWEAEWKRTPHEIIRAAQGEWRQPIIQGWIEAVDSYSSPRWIMTLLEMEESKKEAEQRLSLYLLPQHEEEEIVLTYLREQLAEPYGKEERTEKNARDRLNNIPLWSDKVTDSVLEECSNYIRENRVNSNWLYFSLPLWVALKVRSEQLDELIEVLTGWLRTYPQEEIYGRKSAIDESIELARLRLDMRKAILGS